MGRVVAIANQKGGVGKTTTAVNLSASLATQGKAVVLVDLDPQSNSTSGVGLLPNEIAHSTYSVLAGSSSAAEALVPTKVPGLSVLPTNRDLAGAEIELVSQQNREVVLRDSLATLAAERDFVMLDCPPSLGLLTINGLAAADAVIVPLQCEYYAMEGLSALLETIEMVRSSLNPRLELDGVVLTMFDTRNSICHQVAEQAREHFGDRVFRTVIPRNVRLSESPSFGLPIILYDPGSRGAQSYVELAREYVGRREGSNG